MFHINENYFNCFVIDTKIDMYVPFGKSIDYVTFEFTLPFLSADEEKKPMEHNLIYIINYPPILFKVPVTPPERCWSVPGAVKKIHHRS